MHAPSIAPVRSTETVAAYSIVEDEDGPDYPRISAVSSTDVEIAGAYRHPHREYWLLYVTPLLAGVAEVEFRADHLRLFSHDEARLWVDMLAHLFVKSCGSRRSPLLRQLEAMSA
jgi:hypothetical protein